MTDEQKTKVYKVQTDYSNKIADLQKQIKDLRAQEQQDLLKVLTDAQKLRLKEIQAEKTGTKDQEPPKKEEPKPKDKPK